MSPGLTSDCLRHQDLDWPGPCVSQSPHLCTSRLAQMSCRWHLASLCHPEGGAQCARWLPPVGVPCYSSPSRTSPSDGGATWDPPWNFSYQRSSPQLCLVARDGYWPGIQSQTMQPVSMESEDPSEGSTASLGMASTCWLCWAIYGEVLPCAGGCPLKVAGSIGDIGNHLLVCY